MLSGRMTIALFVVIWQEEGRRGLGLVWCVVSIARRAVNVMMIEVPYVVRSSMSKVPWNDKRRIMSDGIPRLKAPICDDTKSTAHSYNLGCSIHPRMSSRLH